MKAKMLNGLRRCPMCGKRFLLQGYEGMDRLTHIVNTKKICHECAYWEALLANPPENSEVSNGVLLRIFPYIDKEDLDEPVILGSKGKSRYFMRSDGELIRSNDVWRIGTVPERYRAEFPDTLMEISGKAYRSLKLNPSKCFAKGCFDRYGCYRYDLSCEKDGEFNKIPKSWKIGGERCFYLIRKEEINITK